MKLDELKLQARGWDKEEIEHAKRVFKAAGTKHKRHKEKFEGFMYWSFLILVVIGVIAGTWLMQPFLIFVPKALAAILMLVFGLLFGLIGGIIIRDIEHFELHHHLIISLIIPVAAIITSILITRKAQIISELINIETNHNPILLGIIFTVGSLLPYIITLWIQRKNYGTE